jgi:hypothetical protein
MERLSKKLVKADQVFDKFLKEHVEKKNCRTLCISIHGDQAVLSGDEKTVQFVNENMKSMTVEELMDVMKTMDDENYKTSQQIRFTPIFARFKGRHRKLERTRDQLPIYLNILGYGKDGSRKNRVEAEEPEGCPDPSYAKLSTVNGVIESIFRFHRYDANTNSSLRASIRIIKSGS